MRLLGARSAQASHANFVEVLQHVERILVDAIGSGAFQFVLAVSSGEKANSQRTRTPGSQQVPYTISYHNGIANVSTQQFRGGEKQVGIGFRVLNLISALCRLSLRRVLTACGFLLAALFGRDAALDRNLTLVLLRFGYRNGYV